MVTAAARRDPLLPAGDPLPEPRPGDTRLTVPGGEAVYRHHRPDPEAFEACWNALDQHLLHARAEAPEALDALLTAWDHHVAAVPGGGTSGDAEAVISWPSRDTAATRVLLAHGLTPKTVCAVRPVTAAAPAPWRAVPIRPLTLADAADAARLWHEELRWEAQFGSTTLRPAAGRNIRQRLAQALAREHPWTWLAGEPGAMAAGMVMVEPPEQPATWATGLTSAPRPGYLGHLVVTAAHRGTGVGTALAHTALTALAEAGRGHVLLHYAALNPLSGPFWHRNAYRPLWTTWHRRL